MNKYLIKTIKINDDAKSGGYAVESDWMYVDPETIHTIDIFGKKFTDKKIVLCKDCEHHEDEEPHMVYCPNIVGSWVNEDFFCGYGEQKEDVEE